MLKELIEYECPNCRASYGSLKSRAGMKTNCECCNSEFVIPVGLRPVRVCVNERPLRPASKPSLIGSLLKHYWNAFKLFLALLRVCWKVSKQQRGRGDSLRSQI